MHIRRLFLTRDRRPALVWRVLAYALSFGVVLTLRGPLETWLDRRLGRIEIGLWRLAIAQVIVVSVAIALTLGVTWVFRRFVDRRAWEEMAMPPPWRRERGRDLALGFGLGMVMILAVFAVEFGLGWIRIVGVKEGFTGATVLALLTARFVHFVGAAVCEEAAYRGYLLQNAGERFPLWIAVLATGAVFASSHFPAGGFGIGFVAAGIIGSVLLAELRLVTKAIWMGVGWHLAWDWMQDGLGMVPGYSPLVVERSGPALWTGSGMAIEGGLLTIVVLTAGVAAVLWWSRATGRAIDWRARLLADPRRSIPTESDSRA